MVQAGLAPPYGTQYGQNGDAAALAAAAAAAAAGVPAGVNPASVLGLPAGMKLDKDDAASALASAVSSGVCGAATSSTVVTTSAASQMSQLSSASASAAAAALDSLSPILSLDQSSVAVSCSFFSFFVSPLLIVRAPEAAGRRRRRPTRSTESTRDIGCDLRQAAAADGNRRHLFSSAIDDRLLTVAVLAVRAGTATPCHWPSHSHA